MINRSLPFAMMAVMALSVSLSTPPAAQAQLSKKQLIHKMCLTNPATQEHGSRDVAPDDGTKAAWNDLYQGKLDQAATEFMAILKANPNNASALIGIGAIQNMLLDFNQSFASLNLALTKNPSPIDTLKAHWYKGNAWQSINRYADAVNEFKLVTAGNPGFPDGHRMLGASLVYLGDRAGAVAEFQAAKQAYDAANDTNSSKFMAEMIKEFQAGQSPAPAAGGDNSKSAMVRFSRPTENLAKLYEFVGSGDRAFFDTSLKWTNGSTLRVAFNGGTPELRQLVVDTAPEWSKYANIKFDFTDPKTGALREWTPNDKDFAAEIRIAFLDNGYYTIPGRTAITNVRPSDCSMNFSMAGFPQNADYMKGTILHEFGHALGFMHEHQHPRSGATTEYRWLDDEGYNPTMDNRGMYMTDSTGRRPGLFTNFSGSDNSWDPLSSFAQVGPYEDSSQFAMTPVMDNLSIMKYATDADLLKTGMASPFYSDEVDVLSDGDKKMASSQYPFPASSTKAK